MNMLLNVVRYHLVDRINFVWLPWGVTASSFVINLVVFAVVPVSKEGGFTYALVALYAFIFAIGIVSVARLLPFGLSLGLSRRTYFLGAVLTVLGLAVVYALAITVMQAFERLSGGWGVDMHFFRIQWLLDGPWYLTWLTAFVLFILVFSYGIWYGLVYRRWDTLGLVTFIAVQAVVLTAGALVATWAHAWPQVGAFFTTLSAIGLTGVLAALAAVLVSGGYATMRHVTV